ncbi:DNA repair transcription protein [Grosmannia clavigera kw1407]|uniref:MMS19 nucleotide excision repair protein n=1 Tax=Grosmannia clavigera (strain kw1407 / UAMH 11150) TaxID=655863 RepID=F0XRQ3_GROCL|nr:DNA repair transcription protein [Grosmannia clavigera kw1407]EFW99491.1 DNA repair transcription protein [Grosmannia clavigera kw1407]
MADFTALATRYVLADDESEQRQLAGEAAEGIKKAPRKSAAVLNWAQSINPWMPGGRAGGDDEADGDVIARAKALGFLAASLEVLDSDVLRVEQVEHLIAFFGAMFAIDHKAGILAAATALRCLCSMKHFRPSMASSVLSHVVKLGDDFRLQAAPTRLAIYDLVTSLISDKSVLEELQQAHGTSCGFLVDLLQLCRNERDPDNLLRWFAILHLLLERYEQMSTAVAEEVFKAVSDYFPISMRSAATPSGTTVEDLKNALRVCFAASSPVAGSVFDFLLKRLDQGDALTNLAPHASRIWNSLKFEVRHGEVPETIDWTLRVIQAISTRLNGTPTDPLDGVFAKDFVDLVLADCINDLSNLTYTKQAGQLLTSTLRGGRRSFNLSITPILTAVKQNLLRAKTAPHIRDLLAFLGDVLRTRQGLVDDEKTADSISARASWDEFHNHDAAILDLLDSVYLSLWNGPKQGVDSASQAEKQSQDPIVLAQIMNGLAELISQRGPSAENIVGPLLCRPHQCMEVFTVLASRAQYSFSWNTVPAPDNFQGLAHEAMLALKTATLVYPKGFGYLVGRAVSSIKEAPLKTIPLEDLEGLKDTLSRLSFVGCSTIPIVSLQENRLCHFLTIVHALHTTLEWLLDERASFTLVNSVLYGIYGSILNIRDAFAQKGVPSQKEKSVGSSATGPDTSQSLSPVFLAYLKEATSLIRQLYLRATAFVADGIELSTDFNSSTDLDEQDLYLHQLSGMATFVIRDLDVEEQIKEKLYEAPSSLFHPGPVKTTVFHNHQGGRADALSLGILRGLRPLCVAYLADIPLSLQSLLEDLDNLDSLPQRAKMVRNGIATILSNKYSASANSRPGNLAEWQKLIEAVKTKLVPINSAGSPSLTPNQFGRLVAIATGAFPRLDKDAKELATLLAFTPEQYASSRTGEQMARSLGSLSSANADLLSAENHSVVKSIYKQWVYSQTVKKLLPLAFPKQQSSESASPVGRDVPSESASSVNAIAIISLVRHMPFSVYEDDVEESLVRILVAAVTTLPSWTDVSMALRVLYVILENRPKTLQGHLKTLVDASINVFGAAPKPAGKVPQPRRGNPPPGCRKQALRLVAHLPTQVEEGLLLPYGPQLLRALSTACGDRVREIREEAQLARENWTKVPL